MLKDLAVGVEWNNQRGGGAGEGYQDYEFFARGQYQNYFYEFRYFYSHEDQTGDEAVSGGDHYMVELGYVYGDLGAKLNITPTFSYDYANDDSDRENHTDYLLEGFFEKKMGYQLFGAKISHLTIGKNVKDGSTISSESQFLGLGAYYVHSFGKLSILPLVHYQMQTGEKKNYDDVNNSQIAMKLRYEI